MERRSGKTPVDIASVHSSTGSFDDIRDNDAYVQGSNNVLERLSRRYFSKNHLDRALGRSQITAIAFAGTIGIGSFNTSGELVAFAGSTGDVLAYVIAGVIVICVMRCLAELVSVRPVEGALMDYPKKFIDEALGFAVGVIYWASECISTACLTAAAARIANNFVPEKALSKGATAGIIVGLWTITLFSNICGIKIYGNLERVVKWIKFLTIFALCVLMIIINIGVGGYPTDRRGRNYTAHSFPPGMKFDGFTQTNITQEELKATGIPGSSGIFLSVWTATTIAIFACQGGDLVIVAAGEAKNPRKDVPPVTRFMYLVPIFCYVMLAFLVGFNINYADPNLYQPWHKAAGHTYPSHSPFIIVLSNTSLAPKILPKVFDALFLFAAYTAANTALYSASRTLYSLAQDYGPQWMAKTVGRTSRGNTPQMSILISSAIGFLAFLGLVDSSFNQPIQSLSAFFTSGLSCVYACECWAFLRFKQGLKYLEEKNDLSRDDKEYTHTYNYYRAHWQPTCAILGILGSLLVLFFCGWPAIYIIANRDKLATASILKNDTDLVFDLLGAYLAPVLFVALYAGYKYFKRTKYVNLRDPELRYLYFLNITEDAPRREKGARDVGYWFKEIWSFIK